MQSLPFTPAQFFQVFGEYNQQVWPAQLLLNAAALAIVWAALRYSARRSALAWALLGMLWLWTGVVYHWLHFASINRAAYLFGALFVLQALLFFATAVRGSLALDFRTGTAPTLGAVVVFGALVLYPVLGMVGGHAYLAGPTFGAPCPVTIFTLGMLLWGRGRVPRHLFVIPLLWVLVGSMAIVSFGVWQDLLMPAAAVAVLVVLLTRRRAAALQPG